RPVSSALHLPAAPGPPPPLLLLGLRGRRGRDAPARLPPLRAGVSRGLCAAGARRGQVLLAGVLPRRASRPPGAPAVRSVRSLVPAQGPRALAALLLLGVPVEWPHAHGLCLQDVRGTNDRPRLAAPAILLAGVCESHRAAPAPS